MNQLSFDCIGNQLFVGGAEDEIFKASVWCSYGFKVPFLSTGTIFTLCIYPFYSFFHWSLF